jgi:hypothetical protein
MANLSNLAGFEARVVPSANPLASGILEPAAGAASGRLEPLDKPKSSGKAAVYSEWRGSVVPISSKSLKKNKVAEKCQAVFDEAKALIEASHPGAHRVQIHFAPNPNAPNRELVTITYLDENNTLRHVSKLSQDLVNKVIRIWDILRPARTSTSNKPLQLWIAGQAETCAQYIDQELDALKAQLGEPKAQHALQNIIATEAAILEVMGLVHSIMKRKQTELENMPPLPLPPRKTAEVSLERLKELYQELHAINRSAVFRPVATWDNTNTDENVSNAEIQKVANQVTLNEKDRLQNLENQRLNQWRNNWVYKKLGAFTPLEPGQIHEHSLDEGDLLFANRWGYYGRQDETARDRKKTPVEQLLVQTMMYLQSNSPLDSHPVLETLDKSIREEIAQGIVTQVKPKVRAVYTKAEGLTRPQIEADPTLSKYVK